MKRVLIESPYAAKTPEGVAKNVAYAKACVRDALSRGEAPYASHLFFTQDGILDDEVKRERQLGIEAGLAWGEAAELTVVYVDRGISNGMALGMHAAFKLRRPIAVRSLWRRDREDLLLPVLEKGSCPLQFSIVGANVRLCGYVADHDGFCHEEKTFKLPSWALSQSSAT